MPKQDPNPLFTVLIPTKDRGPYLHQTLRTCSLQDYDNLEIIVSDDGSTDDTREIVDEAARKDPRIRYVSPGAGVGMLDNFETALDLVRPGYVMALGGDDGLLPCGISGMRDVLRDTEQELLAWPTPVYFYPKTRMEDAQVIMHLKGGKLHTGTRLITSESFLNRQAEALSYVSDIESPMFYVKGVTSTRLVDKVRSRTPDGRFYSCATPDGYSGIILAGEVTQYAFSGMPFSLHGLSPSSSGLGYLKGTAEAKQQSEQFFRDASKRPMHRDLGSQPYSPLITLMTADYLLTARDQPGWPGARPPIDYKSLLVKSVSEMQDALFAYNRIARELGILKGIADHHGLGDFFVQHVERVRRNKKTPLAGNALSPSRIYIDGKKAGIENIYDAAYFTYFAHKLSPMATMGAAWDALVNSVQYRRQASQQGEALPPRSEWKVDAP